jgi:hypothetical protein
MRCWMEPAGMEKKINGECDVNATNAQNVLVEE